LPEGPSIPHRRCPRGQLGGGGGSGSYSSLRQPCKMYGGRYIAAEIHYVLRVDHAALRALSSQRFARLHPTRHLADS
jgi:hypothetical protein